MLGCCVPESTGMLPSWPCGDNEVFGCRWVQHGTDRFLIMQPMEGKLAILHVKKWCRIPCLRMPGLCHRVQSSAIAAQGYRKVLHARQGWARYPVFDS